MGILARIFTWWDGATLGTRLFTRRHGREVGRDGQGNVYFEGRKDPTRRWVIYSGSNDASRVPPDWGAWLRSTVDALPTDGGVPAARAYAKPAVPNLTGTGEAWRPAGSLEAGGQRPRATGDYQAWRP